MALALAPRIRVNGIGPGPALPNARQTQEQFARQAESVPLRHGTSPEEVGRAAVAILALPAMTGQMLALDGGQHLQWAAGRRAPPAGGVAAMDTPRIAASARALRHVFLRDLVLPASIGVHPHEHAAPQRVRINVDLGRGGRRRPRPVARPGGTGRVVAAWWTTRRSPTAVRAIVAAGHVRLVETLAERIAEACLADPAGSSGADAGGEAGHIRRCSVGGRGNRAAAGGFVHAVTARLTSLGSKSVVFNDVTTGAIKIEQNQVSS